MILRIVGFLLLAGLALFGVLVAAVCVCARKERHAAPAQCIIVPGAKVWPDGRMTGTLQKRCRRALELWREDESAIIIPCGGQGADEPVAEAEAMRLYFEAEGVPPARIKTECTSVNTRENLVNARKIMRDAGLRTAVIVTSDYHVQRTLWLARDVGIDARGLAAPSPTTPRAYRRARLREACSWAAYAVRRVKLSDE